MRKAIIKWGFIILVSSIVIGGSIAYYLFNQPHRNIQATAADYQLEATTLVNEYLTNAAAANEKYLHIEGDSKILEVTGIIASIEEDLKHQKVVFLKNSNAKAGVSCTFMATTNAHAKKLTIGESVTIKGVIRSGAGYDEDLELYEDVILEKCDVI